MEYSPICPLCAHGRSEIYMELSDRFDPAGELYHIYSCASCGLIFLDPMPPEEEMSGFYSHDQYDPFSEVEGAVSLSQKIYAWVKPWSLRWKAGVIRKLSPTPGVLMDVGAGTGSFLHTMRRRGWKVMGVEKDERAAEYGVNNLNLDIFNGDLADFSSSGLIFDVISCWHSLEHIHRIRANLSQMRKYLREGGYLVIALPNPDSYDARFYKRFWVAWDTPRHLWHFKPDPLIKLLKGYSFKLHKTIPMPLDPFYNCLLSEQIVPWGGKWWRMTIRFPLIAKLSFFSGLFNPLKASSITYIFKSS